SARNVCAPSTWGREQGDRPSSPRAAAPRRCAQPDRERRQARPSGALSLVASPPHRGGGRVRLGSPGSDRLRRTLWSGLIRVLPLRDGFRAPEPAPSPTAAAVFLAAGVSAAGRAFVPGSWR